jgi:hypothetical protein
VVPCGRAQELNIVVERTDHLDDTALREFLLDLLNQPVSVSSDSGTIMHVDLVGSGSDEDNSLFFRYSASEQERELWTRDFPDEALAPRERPPYDRDRLLPNSGGSEGRALHRTKATFGELTTVILWV